MRAAERIITKKYIKLDCAGPMGYSAHSPRPTAHGLQWVLGYGFMGILCYAYNPGPAHGAPRGLGWSGLLGA